MIDYVGSWFSISEISLYIIVAKAESMCPYVAGRTAGGSTLHFSPQVTESLPNRRKPSLMTPWLVASLSSEWCCVIAYW